MVKNPWYVALFDGHAETANEGADRDHYNYAENCDCYDCADE